MTEEVRTGSSGLRKFERELLESVDGICERAEKVYLKKLKSDDELQAIFNVCSVHDRLRVMTGHIRSSILSTTPEADRGIDGIARASSRIMRSFLDLPLLGGLKLGDATWEELDEEIEIREKLARGNAVQAEFFKKVRRAVPSEKKHVRDVLTDAKLRQMYKRAEKAR